MSAKTVISLIVIYSLAALLAIAGSSTSILVSGVPLFALAVGLIFLLQWLAFIPAWLMHTERFYDLTGGVTYLSVVVLILWAVVDNNPRSQLLGVLVAIWALRLSSFLFVRVMKDGFDRRFTKIKQIFGRFFVTWNLQGLWVTFTGAAAYTAMSTDHSLLSDSARGIDAWAIAGGLIWLFGFLFEVVADEQKKRFRAIPENHDRFIQTGLWARCRHPNYFGEIMLWLGIAIIAVPALKGWAMATLISPIFVYLLLTKISGIPLLAASSKQRWGHMEDYQQYIQKTPLLLPLGRP